MMSLDRIKALKVKLKDSDEEDYLVNLEKPLMECIAEIERLNKIILQEIYDNDEVGSEFTFVMVLKEDHKRLKSRLRQRDDEFKQACRVLAKHKIDWELE